MILYFWMMIQVLGESLPISSSGHVALLQKIIASSYAQGLSGSAISFGASQDLWAFDYLLQGISAIVFFIYFFPSWWQIVIDKPIIKFSSLLDYDVWKKNIAPVFIFGCAADSMTFLLWACKFTNWSAFPLALGFMITAVVLWSTQYTHPKKDLNIWSWKHGVLVGLAQGCALLPGISRFAITVGALQWLGYPQRLAFSISFLLQWPLIVAGSLAGLYSLHDSSIIEQIWTAPFLIGMMIMGACAYLLILYMGKIIDRKLLWKFSYYMIIPTVVALFI